MSVVGLRGHRAIPVRYDTVCSSCLRHLQRSEGRVPSRVLAARGSRQYADWHKIEHPEWRKQAVQRWNARTPDDLPKESYTPNTKTKDGFMNTTLYSLKPDFPPISTERLPDVDPGPLPEDRRNLDTTRSAPLDDVVRKPDDSTFSYYLRLGRAYLKFYKTGMKNIRRNWNEFSEIKGWLTPFTIGASARYGGTNHVNKKRESVPIPHISRREYILYFRTKHDLFKLLPFGLVILVCGEFTPLVIILLGNRVTPYTCRIPSQQRTTLDNALQRFRTFQREMRILTSKSVPTPRHALDFQPPSHHREHPWRRDALFAHLVNQTNFSTLPFPLTANLYWHFTLQPRLSAYWDKIFCDSLLIIRAGGFSSLSPQDIFEYALNYGSLSLLVIMQYEIKHKKNYDFVNESLKDRLVPILDAEAEVMFNEDFTRLHPSMHWARAYRDSTRWGTHTPDIQGALKLMREFGMEWSTDLESWGGDWRFKSQGANDKVKATAEAGQNAHTELDARTDPKPLETLALRQQGLDKDTNAMQQQLINQQSSLKETDLLHQQRAQQRAPLSEDTLAEEPRKEKIPA